MMALSCQHIELTLDGNLNVWDCKFRSINIDSCSLAQSRCTESFEKEVVFVLVLMT